MAEIQKPTCFIISPIGSPKSETRKRSDDLKSLIIEDALESFDFDVKRADDSVTPTPITNDIISFIQNSDLCIVDLTDNNPNVMYEFGRRQETGKPYILLAQKDVTLPFDINSIRTIFYDLTDPHNIRDCKKRIKEYIKHLQNNGFQRESSGESLSSIAEQIRRIERKVDSLTMTSNSNPFVNQAFDDDGLTPEMQFALAIQEKNIAYAEGMLSFFERTKQKDIYYDQFLEVLAKEGSIVALNKLAQDIQYIYDLPEQRQIEAISIISYAFQHADREEEGLELLAPIIDKCLDSFKDNNHKAIILNQKARLVLDMESQIRILNKVIELSPDNPSYYFNISVCYEELDNLALAKEYIDTCISKQKSDNEKDYDPDHVSQAIDVYAKLHDKETVDKYLTILHLINPNLYKLKKQLVKKYFK